MQTNIELTLEIGEGEEFPVRQIEADIKKIKNIPFMGDLSLSESLRRREIHIRRHYGREKIVYEVFDGKINHQKGNISLQHSERYESLFQSELIKIRD